MDEPSFEWDEAKNTLNLRKHGVSFYEAQHAFLDPRRVIASDEAHKTGSGLVLTYPGLSFIQD